VLAGGSSFELPEEPEDIDGRAISMTGPVMLGALKVEAAEDCVPRDITLPSASCVISSVGNSAGAAAPMRGRFEPGWS
jgi:hypothetical protein